MTDAIGFARPDTIEEAVEILAEHDDARCLAGGATLVAMMNAGLVEPAMLVSLSRIPELRGFERRADGSVRIGAMRRHRETAFESDLRAGQRVVAEAAAQIANPPVRNMGTMGGSVAFADPAADYPAALVAAAARVEVAGPEGRRELDAEAFFVDWYETALAPGELVTAVVLPPAPAGSIARYNKLARVSGDFGIATVAVSLAMEEGRCRALRVAVGGCGPRPARVAAAEDGLVGTRLEPDRISEAGAAIVEACDPVDDVRASAAYRRMVVPRMIARALREAAAVSDARHG